MQGDYIPGSNKRYGPAKRKRSSGVRSESASKLSRKLFSKGSMGAPQISAAVFDKAVGRALKSRMISSPEQKFVETVSSAAAVSSTAVMTLLNGMVLGTTDNTRIGEKIRITKVELNATIHISNTAVGGRDMGKISLFLDKQANGSAPGGFSAAPNNSTIAPYTNNGTNYNLLKNAIYDKQFYIIKDWDYCIDATAGVASEWQQNIVRFRAEVPIGRVVHYNDGNAGTIADIVTNGLYLGYVSS